MTLVLILDAAENGGRRRAEQGRAEQGRAERKKRADDTGRVAKRES